MLTTLTILYDITLAVLLGHVDYENVTKSNLGSPHKFHIFTQDLHTSKFAHKFILHLCSMQCYTVPLQIQCLSRHTHWITLVKSHDYIKYNFKFSAYQDILIELHLQNPLTTSNITVYTKVRFLALNMLHMHVCYNDNTYKFIIMPACVQHACLTIIIILLYVQCHSFLCVYYRLALVCVCVCTLISWSRYCNVVGMPCTLILFSK